MNRLRIARFGVRPLRHRRLFRHEEVVQMPRYEARGGFLFADDVDDVFAVEVARLPQECLIALIVVGRVVLEVPSDSAIWPDGVSLRPQRHILGVAQRPAGKGARRLFDVVLRVVAHAHAEQLQQFAPVVFVDCALVIVVIVQPHNHSRIARELQKQRLEVAHSVAAEHPNLVVDDLALRDFGIARSEYGVPEERHLFLQRRFRGNHLVEPVRARVLPPHHPGLFVMVAPNEVVGHSALFGGVQQFRHDRVVALRLKRIEFVARCAKAGAPHQMRYLFNRLRSLDNHSSLLMSSVAARLAAYRLMGW